MFNYPNKSTQGSQLPHMTTIKKRLFFALWPDADYLRAIAERTNVLVRDGRGRPVRSDNLHMTLAFLHLVDVSLLPCVVNAASQVRQDPFELELSQIGCWKKSGILWLAPPEHNSDPICTPVQQLSRALWQALTVCGMESEQQRYRPHMTLARKTTVSPKTKSLAAIHWPVREFVLAESITGGSQAEYVVLQRFALRQEKNISS